MATKRKTKKKKQRISDFLESSKVKNIEFARIISYLRCKDAGIKFPKGSIFDDGSQEEAKKLIKKLSKSQLENYKRIAGVGKYRSKVDRNGPKRCPHCGEYPSAPSQFPSRMDTWTPQPSLVDVLRDYEQRNAYANEIR